MKTDPPTTSGEPPLEALIPIPGSNALGSDPLAEAVDVDPFEERLDALGLEQRARAAPSAAARAAVETKPQPTTDARRTASTARTRQRPEPKLARIHQRRWTTTPSLSEIDVPIPR